MSDELASETLLQEVAAHSGRDADEIERFLDVLVEQLTTTLLADGRVRLRGLGTFRLSDVRPHLRSGAPGEDAVEVPARTRVLFRPSRVAATLVNFRHSHLTPTLLDPTVADDAPAATTRDGGTDPAPPMRAGNGLSPRKLLSAVALGLATGALLWWAVRPETDSGTSGTPSGTRTPQARRARPQQPEPAAQPPHRTEPVAAAVPTSESGAFDSTPSQTSAHRTIETDPPITRTYQVRSGDTLSSIATAVYGDWRLWPLLFAANQPTLSHPDGLEIGGRLRTPVLPEPARFDAPALRGRLAEACAVVARAYAGNNIKAAAYYHRLSEKLR